MYTVPAATSTVVSTIAICNLAGSSATYRIAVRPAGMAAVTQNWIVYGATVAANDSVLLTIGLTLATTDIITVYGSAVKMSFTVFGSEIA